MPLRSTGRPQWLTFDCYGTLIQWDEGLLAAVRDIVQTKSRNGVNIAKLLEIYDRHEHRLEQTPPHRSFRRIAGDSLRLALEELGLQSDERDAEALTRGISAMPPFPEVLDTLLRLNASGYRLCIVSNTDDDIIDRGTGRSVLPDYTPDATLAALDQVPPLLASVGG
jgi:2-haloacid dehalogenase